MLRYDNVINCRALICIYVCIGIAFFQLNRLCIKICITFIVRNKFPHSTKQVFVIFSGEQAVKFPDRLQIRIVFCWIASLNKFLLTVLFKRQSKCAVFYIMTLIAVIRRNSRPHIVSSAFWHKHTCCMLKRHPVRFIQQSIIVLCLSVPAVCIAVQPVPSRFKRRIFLRKRTFCPEFVPCVNKYICVTDIYINIGRCKFYRITRHGTAVHIPRFNIKL